MDTRSHIVLLLLSV
nr:unnamed protein product [Callosobruchus chinensis]